jgi:hypothetical protein
MRRLGRITALTAVALAFAVSPVAQADPGIDTVHLVDITIDCGDFTCTWTDIPVGGTPPGPVSVDPSSSTGSCTNGVVCTLDRFNLLFSDSTAMIDQLSYTCTREFGISCGYSATNVVLTRNGTTGEYTGGFTATRYSGNVFFCRSSQSGSIRLVFH